MSAMAWMTAPGTHFRASRHQFVTTDAGQTMSVGVNFARSPLMQPRAVGVLCVTMKSSVMYRLRFDETAMQTHSASRAYSTALMPRATREGRHWVALRASENGQTPIRMRTR